MLLRILRRLARRSRTVVLLSAGLSLVLLAAVDYLTGPELRFFIFYWPAIAVAAWYGGRGWGYAFVALAGAGWVAANLPQYQSRYWVAVWNALVNATSFAFLAYAVGIIRDLFDREHATARTDALTGAANLRAFLERVELEIKRCARAELPISLAYLDADNFKVVNDRLGHAAGDALLQRAAAKIAGHVRATDCLARLGGDEFALLMPGADRLAAIEVMQRIHRELGSLAAETGLPVSFSAGLVVCSGPACTPEQLIGRADALMYEVKAAGKDGIRIAEVTAAHE